jgi:hypothetical protein
MPRTSHNSSLSSAPTPAPTLPTDRSGRVFRAASQTPGGRFALVAITRKVARGTHRPMTLTTDTVNGALKLIGDGGGLGCATWGERDETLDLLAASVTFGPGFNRGVN